MAERLIVALVGLMLSIPAPVAAAAELPKVASLSVCADQYILMLADRDQIVSLSSDATG